MRNIFSLPYNESTNPYFIQANILKIHDIYKLNVGKLIFKNLTHGNYAFLSDRITRQSSIHSHVTRSSCELSVPRFSQSTSQKFISYQGIKLWNEILVNIKSVNNLNSFKKLLFLHLMSNY